MKKIILAIAILALATLPRLWGRVGVKSAANEAPVVSAKLVSSLDAKQLLKDKKVFLLDVHTPEQTHIPGTNVFVPFDQIEANLDKLPQDKTTPILVYCRSGNMSKTASEKLVSLGYQTVYDLEGGTNAFKEVNAEVVITPGSHAFGEVVYGQVAQTELTLTNFNPAPLKITRVSTSCGCTKAEVENKELKAYEATKIKVTFDPAVHKDDTDLGELSRLIYIETDNPNFAKLTGEITATVIKKKSI